MKHFTLILSLIACAATLHASDAPASEGTRQAPRRRPALPLPDLASPWSRLFGTDRNITLRKVVLLLDNLNLKHTTYSETADGIVAIAKYLPEAPDNRLDTLAHDLIENVTATQAAEIYEVILRNLRERYKEEPAAATLLIALKTHVKPCHEVYVEAPCDEWIADSFSPIAKNSSYNE